MGDMYVFCFYRYGDHRDLHVLTHSFPTRRSSTPRRLGAFALLVPLLLPLTLHAQSLPKPKEFYFDGDGSTTAPLVLLEGSDAATQERLLKAMKGHGRNADLATAQLAHIAYASDRPETGSALYARVLADLGNNSRMRQRSVAEGKRVAVAVVPVGGG